MPDTPPTPRPADRPQSSRLAVLVVNYNGWADVARLVGGLSTGDAVTSGRAEVVVVDNASDDPPPPALLGPIPHLSILRRPTNGGFSAGVNAGRLHTKAPWLLLLNPDVVAGPGFLDAVLAAIEARSADPAGVVGFGLRNADGSRQPSVGADPGLARSLREAFIPRTRRKYQAESRVRPGAVPWVTGACALVDAAMLDALGGMDEEFFLYYEEVALCRRARDLGRRVEYDPSVEVVHLRPLQGREVSPTLRYVTRHSKLLYFRKHLPRWQFLGLSWAVGVEARLRGWAARLGKRGDEAGSWRGVGWLAAAMRRGERIGGREVLLRAEAAVGAGWKGPRRVVGRPIPTSKEQTT